MLSDSVSSVTGFYREELGKDCPLSYMGQSGRSLLHRVKEHRQAITNADFNAFALADHTWNNGHGIDRDNATILAQNIYTYPRLYLESWHIQHQDDIMNRESGILPLVYKCLMTQHFLHPQCHHLSLSIPSLCCNCHFHLYSLFLS